MLVAFAFLLACTKSYAAPPSVHLSQIDKSNFPAIRTYVEVDDGFGSAIKHLGPAQFTVFENGARTQIVGFVDPDQARSVSTVLVLDCSGSMLQGGKMDGLKTAAYAYVKLMKPEDRSTIVPFAGSVGTVQPLTSEKDVLAGELQSLQADGRTALFDALDRAVEILSREPGRRAVLAMTDGMDNASWKSADDIVDFARRFGIPIYTVGLGEAERSTASESGVDEAVLERIAQQTGGIYSYAPSAAELPALYKSLARRFRSSYEISYESPKPVQDGTTRLVVVSLASGSLTEQSTNSYYLPGVVVASSDFRVFLALGIPLLFLLAFPSIVSSFGRKRARRTWS